DYVNRTLTQTHEHLLLLTISPTTNSIWSSHRHQRKRHPGLLFVWDCRSRTVAWIRCCGIAVKLVAYLEFLDDVIVSCRQEVNVHFFERSNVTIMSGRSIYYATTDVFILRFMLEACWAPIVAAFTDPFDQSEDDIVISQCLEGFAVCNTCDIDNADEDSSRCFYVTSLAKFTSLHSLTNIKQKNIEAIKHLHLLGEGVTPDATLFAVNQNESNKIQRQSQTSLQHLINKGVGRIQQVAAAMRRGIFMPRLYHTNQMMAPSRTRMRCFKDSDEVWYEISMKEDKIFLELFFGYANILPHDFVELMLNYYFF
ncbi:LOW QUALITY PROTEIN: hypothetical protein M8C21_008757, partial [Ambrosia artemisiifolia]